jgi:Domain of Unknown Function (DUF928)
MKISMYSISWAVCCAMLAQGIVIGWSDFSTMAQARSSQKIKFRLPAVPKGDPPRGTPSGGAGRDQCPKVDLPLTVMMPSEKKVLDSGATVYDVWSLTTREAPVLWFYSPYDNGDRFPVELIVRENNLRGKILARRSVTLPSKPGVFPVTMPEKLPGLQIDERRFWQLNLSCSSDRSGVPIRLDGVVQRSELMPSDLKALEAANNPHDLAVEYADRGMWIDALDTIGTARTANPEDVKLKADWKELLDSVCLSKFVLD